MVLLLTRGKKIKLILKFLTGRRFCRLDINAYTRHDTWVPTFMLNQKEHLHTNNKLKYTKCRSSNQADRDQIVMDIAKTPFARIGGNLINRTDEDVTESFSSRSFVNDPSRDTQVGFNPDRHSYFFDRATGDPIIAGDEAIQVNL